MNSWIDSIIKKYAKFISNNPIKVLIITLIITVASVILASNVSTTSLDNEDAIPDGYTVKEAFDIIGNDFGDRDSLMISVELNKRTPEQINDLREPFVVEYIHKLSVLSEEFRDIREVNSLSTYLKEENNGKLPHSKSTIKRLVSENELYFNYISEDFTHSVIRLDLEDGYTTEEVVNDLQELINNVEKPAPLKVSPAGELATNPIIEDEIGPDMQKTSQIAIVGILIILLLLFGSVRYAFTPLAVIIAGVIWAYGYFGLTGVEIDPATSGSITMIIGIGIDFGIQTIKRFRQELENKEPSMAMEETIYRVLPPMFIATLAAIIGFRAMAVGELTIMEDLGTLLSYGVATCFLAAITIVPAISVIGEKIRIRKKSDSGGKKNDKKK